MAENSKIEWTHHTFNPWRGCTKVSDGCKHCYAEALSKRNSAILGVWGDNGTRVLASKSYWEQPLKWDRDAAKAGERRRVFCASLADVFEDRPELIDPRHRLMLLIEQTPNLDWLLLTKRPERVSENVPVKWFRDGFPSSIWLGVSVENQGQADKRIPELLEVPAAVRFLSCEPLLGAINLQAITALDGDGPDSNLYWIGRDTSIDWVIAGGESGHAARPMHPDWARFLRDQCQVAGVPFFFKQWGEFLPAGEVHILHPLMRKPPAAEFDGVRFVRVGKKYAGRFLDDRTWDELPK